MKFKKYDFETLKSTNETAVEYEPGAVIIAREQTGGRGRYGKKWESPRGNLYMSVVLTDMGQEAGNLAFVIAVAVARALKEFNVQVKWPNDILLDGKKLVGILLERAENKIIAGIGVNIVSAPKANMAYETADLGGAMTVNQVVDKILIELSNVLDILNTQGFPVILTQWKQYAIGMGTPILVNLPGAQLQGIFRDLSLSGALMLELPDKTITEVTAGTVFFTDK